MARGYGGWAPYVSVAERRRQAEKEMAKLKKQGHPVSPVEITGRTIATTFWGKAWCDNLESYHDYENRLPRGRTYVRNGSVIDLQIAPMEIKAQVSGSSIYRVAISIKASAKAQWQSLCRECAGGIDSLVELLQGRLSKGVMERLCRQDNGLFPKPSEIRFSCSCPDSASLCKHIAAVLYGVGSRLDQQPELLFRLRGVNERDLVGHLDAAVPLSGTGPTAGKILEGDDLSALFGLDMAGSAPPAEAPIPTPPAPTPSVPKPPAPKPAARTKPARATTVAVPRQKAHASESSTENRPAPETGGTGPAKAAGRRFPRPRPVKPNAAPVATGDPARLAPQKAEVELTPDGFVKWWE